MRRGQRGDRVTARDAIAQAPGVRNRERREREMSETTPVVVSIINLKGGVGKTTVATLLAKDAARRGIKVLAVDMDPQANLSQALLTESEYEQFMADREPSVVELFNGYRPASDENPAPQPLDDIMKQVGNNEGFHILPSRFDFSDNLISSVKPNETVLARYIASGMTKKKDLVLIDCAPTESIITRTAYHASRYILVPVRTEFFSTIGFPLLKTSLDDFLSRNRGHQLDVCGVLINNSVTRMSPLGPHHTSADNEIREKAAEYGWPVMKEEMFHSRGYQRLMNEQYIAHSNNAEYEFPKIAEEFFKLINFPLP